MRGGVRCARPCSDPGAGLQPTERINLFAYLNQFDMRLRGQNVFDFETAMDSTTTQGAVGMSYRWGPTEQTWVKLGRSVNDTLLRDYPTVYLAPPFVSLMGVGSRPQKDFTDLQLRHTLDTAPGSRFSVTGARAKASTTRSAARRRWRQTSRPWAPSATRCWWAATTMCTGASPA